jgi:hypothetical protein
MAGASYTYDGAASVRGVALRVTKLGADGAPDPNADCPVYLTTGFIRFAFTPEYSDGDEVEIKNAAGEVCVYYKMPDTLKQITFALELCDPDPVLTQALSGGDILVDTVDITTAVGFASAPTGTETTPYGVAVEVWASAVSGGRIATTKPFWHYVFPWAQLRLTGERALENGNLATVFEGRGLGNAEFGSGPSMAGVTPATQYQWPFPAYTDRPYAYARVDDAPTGLMGCYDLV